MQFVKAAKSPQAALSQLASRNPQLQKVLQDAGNDPKKAFYSLAKQNGIEPNDILDLLK